MFSSFLQKAQAVLKSRVFIFLFGFFCLAILIWFIGPLIAVAGYEPLASASVRFFVLLGIGLIWGALNLLNKVKDKKNNDDMVNKLLHGGDSSVLDDAADGAEEIKILGGKIQQALDILKSAKLSKGKNIYQLPWYIMIGPPGSGKTSTIHNSGLNFPLKEQMGVDMLQGVGGTRHCDWWFTDQAVLIDTAGRYTSQDSHAKKDSRAWQGFLGLLRKYRPKRPINGVIINVGVSELLNQTKTERNITARGIKQRLQELQNQLGMKFPVYLLFTKSDLIAGFNEFFDDLSDTEAKQVWGLTFELTDIEDKSPAQLFNKEFHQLLTHLNARINKRLLNERDLSRKTLIYEFPKQLRLLQSAADDFLKEIFSPNAYEDVPMLRGIYLTSATQEGTPIDQLSSHLGIAPRDNKFEQPTQVRSYFIRQLFEDIIFPERDIASTNRHHDKQNLLLRNGIVGLSTVTTIVFSYLWWSSYSWNSQLVDNTKVAIDNFLIESDGGLTRETEIIKLVNSLSLLRSFPVGYNNSLESSDVESMGLYQGDKLKQPAISAYKRALQAYLFPYMIRALIDEMEVNSNHLNYLYETLKTYLMLYQPEYFIKEDVHAWFDAYLERKIPGEINKNTRVQLSQHLISLLDFGIQNQDINELAVSNARKALTNLPLVEKAYQRLKSDYAQSSIPDFRLIDLLSLESLQAFRFQSGREFTDGIPGLFTFNGFHGIFSVEKNRIIKRLIEDSWVYGDDINSLNDETKAKITAQLEQKYIRDYIYYWEDLLSDLTVQTYYDASSGADITKALSGPEAPIKQIITEVKKNVTLTKLPLSNNQKAAGEVLKSASNELLRQKKSRIERLLPKDGVDVEIDLPGKEVELAFKEVIELDITQFDEIQTTLRSINRYLDKVAYSSNLSLEQNLNSYKKEGSQLVSQSEEFPYPISNWLEGVAEQTASITRRHESERLNEIWQSQVVAEYRRAISGRYPFKQNSMSEVRLKDFSRFFGYGGTLDDFFNKYLKQHVDKSKSQWRFTREVGISQEVLRMYQYADNIQQAFFESGSKNVKIEFNLEPVSLDKHISHFLLEVAGQELNYRHGPVRSKQFFWPGNPENSETRIVFTPPNGGRSINTKYSGAWSLFRFLDEISNDRPLAKKDGLLEISLNGNMAKVRLLPNSVYNPFWSASFAGFSCPERL